MIRVSTMMLGEIDFLNTFLQPMRQQDKDQDQTNWTRMAAATWFLMVFAILMPILLMNLLIGLAVGDIETVRRNASMKRLAMQVEHHTDLEMRLPQQILKYVRKTEVYEYPNKRSNQCATAFMVMRFSRKSTLFMSHSAPFQWSLLKKIFVNSANERPVRTVGDSEQSLTISNLAEELFRQRKR